MVTGGKPAPARIGTYSTIDEGIQITTGRSLPASKPVGYISTGLDIFDLMKSGNPIGGMNVLMKVSDYLIQKKK